MADAAFVAAVEVVVIVAAGLLVPAGIAKLRRPTEAGEALGLGGRGRDGLVRLVGSGEVVLALWVLLVGARVAVGVLAGAYAAFAIVATRQRRRGAGCGCFGSAATPASWGHVALNGVVAITAGTMAVAAAPVALVGAVREAGPLTGAALLIAGAAAVATAQLVLTALPDLSAARRRSTAGVRP